MSFKHESTHGNNQSGNIDIHVDDLSKCYQIYETPRDRLKQFIFPAIQRFFHWPEKCYFREFWALKNVSFDVKKGETIGIVGKNGSGKSTLLQIICGTLYPTGGGVETKGRIAALLELGSGFNPEFSGRENIYLNASILGLSHQETDERFDEIVTFADIGDFIEQPVKTYSSGMVVRLAFAIQANVDPGIIIIDEALAVGDSYFVHKCMLRFRELQESGTTILFVSHDANMIRNVCTKAIWLVDGQIKKQGVASNVVDDYLAYLFDRPAVSVSKTPTNTTSNSELGIEHTIPNISRRLGDQRCEIVGVSLYDKLMSPISSSQNETSVTLRLTMKNISLDVETKLVVGYVFRNAKGQEIASTNSQIEGITIRLCPIDDFCTVKMNVVLPRLYPGSYSFSPTLGYLDISGTINLADRIDDAVVFDILSSKAVHVMMGFHTTIELEG